MEPVPRIFDSKNLIGLEREPKSIIDRRGNKEVTHRNNFTHIYVESWNWEWCISTD